MLLSKSVKRIFLHNDAMLMHILGTSINSKIFGTRGLWILVFIVIIATLILLLSQRVDKTELLIDYVEIESSRDIVVIADSQVVPRVYRGVTMLDQIPIEERKQRFIDVILPSIMIVRHRLNQQKERVMSLDRQSQKGGVLESADSAFIAVKMAEYHAHDIEDLIVRLTPHPVSIALAQSALESGWGTSRFFKQANNVFGVWSFDPEEPRMLASYRRNGNPVYLRKYDDLLESVGHYFRLLSTVKLYREFRKKRFESDNVFELIWFLKNYSEKRNQYVILLRNVIVANDLTRYDHYQIHPDHFIYPSESDTEALTRILP
jgi:Bax protein